MKGLYTVDILAKSAGNVAAKGDNMEWNEEMPINDTTVMSK